MNPHAVIRAEARRRRKQLLESAAAQLGGSQDMNLAEFRRDLEVLDALANLRSRREWLVSGALPLALALLVLLPLWLIRQPAPAIELSARASRIVVALDGSGKLDLGKLPTVRNIRLEGLAAVSSDTAGVGYTDQAGRGTWYLEGSVNVSGMTLTPLRPTNGPAAEQLVIARRGDAGQIGVEGMMLQLSASVESTASAVWTGGAAPRKVALRNASIQVDGASSAPSKTRVFFLLGKEPAHLPVLRPRALSLRETGFDTSGRTENHSSVLDGQLVFAGSGRKHALARSTELSLDGLDGTLHVSFEPDGVRLSYAGTAKGVHLGSEASLVRDLRPSLAEWLSRDPVVPLVWSSFVFVAGLAWSVRRFVRKPS